MIKRRVFAALFSITACFFFVLLGGYFAFHKDRCVFGSALMCFGVLLSEGELFLYWMTSFAWTWGWM
jgi:hypothetical protein